MYCYKVKWPLLKIKENNAYAHAKIEEYGFEPIFEQPDEGEPYWAGGWAKKVQLPHDCEIGQWLKKNVESIYKSERAKLKPEEGSKWIKEITDAGYEFNEDGTLIENDKAKEPTSAELCIMLNGDYHGTLFINIGGAMEIYDARVLRNCLGNEIYKLETDKVIYEKRFYEHEDA